MKVSNFLFQIFLKLGTPNDMTWEGFTSLPNYQFEFPNSDSPIHPRA